MKTRKLVCHICTRLLTDDRGYDCGQGQWFHVKVEQSHAVKGTKVQERCVCVGCAVRVNLHMFL